MCVRLVYHVYNLSTMCVTSVYQMCNLSLHVYAWPTMCVKMESPLLTLCNRILLKGSFQSARAPHIIIVTRPPTVYHGQDLNPGPLSFKASALLPNCNLSLTCV